MNVREDGSKRLDAVRALLLPYRIAALGRREGTRAAFSSLEAIAAGQEFVGEDVIVFDRRRPDLGHLAPTAFHPTLNDLCVMLEGRRSRPGPNLLTGPAAAEMR